MHASATAVWPPTGIAIASLLLTRYRVWPAILLGAFVVNATTEGNLLTSAGIALGNTSEGVLGAWLVNRFARGPDVFERPQDIFRFALYAAVVATTVSATIGVTTLVLGGYASWSRYDPIWLTWWLGDAAGALIVAPPIVLWSRDLRLGYRGWRAIEAVLVLLTAIGASLLVFRGGLELIGLARFPLSFLTLPPLIWAAFRFGPREAATLILVTSAIANWGTLSGASALTTGAGTHESLLVLQAFMATITGMTLPTAAVVAERRRAQQRLHESEIAYRSMFEASPHPMWVVDRETVAFLAVNDAAVAHYGYSRDEFLRMTSMQIRPSEDLPRLARARRRLGEDGTYFGLHQHRTKDGRLIDAEVTAHLIEFGGRPAALVLAYDVTDRARAQERERQALAEAEEANRAKDEFLATLSHELRTPLNAMLGWVTMLRGDQLDQNTARRALETIERNTRLQARLIEDLLDVSRITADKLALDMTPVLLTGVVEAAVDAIRPAAAAKAIALELALDRATPPVMGDATRLQQVVYNLVSNAIKFTPTNGRVAVRLTKVNDRVSIRVSDTGQGIPADFLPHIFDRFRQAETASTRRHGGLGLGLTIVRHLVRVHGGTVRAESAGEGQGAAFIVEFPAVRIATGAPVAADVRSFGSALTGLRILIVDDDPDSRSLTATTLEKAGADTVTAESVAEARTALAHARFDVLVADIAMAGEDGFDLIRHVRANESTRTLAAVAFTAYASRHDRRHVLDAGYDGHIAKPVEPHALVEAVGAVVSRRRAG